MAKKVLVAASTFSHIRNFHLPYLAWFAKNGFQTDVLGSGDSAGIPPEFRTISIPFRKRLASPANFLQAFRIARLLRRERYDAVFLHTSLAAFFVRLGILFSFRRRPPVVNTVHGYLFDSQTPLFKRILLLGAEKLTAPVTDVIFTMNRQDNELAQRHKLFRRALVSTAGMGADFTRFSPPLPPERRAARGSFGYSDDAFVLLYAAEFSKRKNQEFLIRAAARLRQSGCPGIRLLLPGNGALLPAARKLTQALGAEDILQFPGYVEDTRICCYAADLCVSSSRSEGLPFNLIEGMACGLPVVATRVKGNEDLIEPGVSGFLFEFNNEAEFCSAVEELYRDRKRHAAMGEAARLSAQPYGLGSVFPDYTGKLAAQLPGLFCAAVCRPDIN